MLPRQRRLVRDRDIQLVYRRGRRSRGTFITWYSLPRSASLITCYAVVVSRRVDKRATVRNLVKRRLWAALRVVAPTLPLRGVAVVCLAQPQAARATYRDLVSEVKKISPVTRAA